MFHKSEAELQPSQISKTDIFLKIVENFKPLNIFSKKEVHI